MTKYDLPLLFGDLFFDSLDDFKKDIGVAVPEPQIRTLELNVRRRSHRSSGNIESEHLADGSFFGREQVDFASLSAAIGL